GAVSYVLETDFPIVRSPEDFAGQMRELRLEAVAPASVLGPLSNVARDETGILVFESRPHAYLPGLIRVVRAVQPEPGVPRLDECPVRQDTCIHDVRRGIVAVAERDRSRRREVRGDVRDEVVDVVIPVG